MSVYDKELIINGKVVRNVPQQVRKNMKDIEELQAKIKPTYKCVGELNTASIAIARSLTNVPEGVEEGWLIDAVGSLFSITGADDDSLLIQFYASLVGPEGPQGPAGKDGQDGGNAKVFKTLVTPALISYGLYSLPLVFIMDIYNNEITESDISEGDVLYNNLDNQILHGIYMVSYIEEGMVFLKKISDSYSMPLIDIDTSQMISLDEAQLTDDQYNILFNNSVVEVTTVADGKKYCFIKPLETPFESSIKFKTLVDYDVNDDVFYYTNAIIDTTTKRVQISNTTIPSAKQKYKHIIKLDLGLLGVYVTIENNDITPFDYTSLMLYLNDEGFTSINNLYPTNGGHYRDTNSNVDYSIIGIFELSNTIQCGVIQNGVNSSTYKSIPTLSYDKVLPI